MLEKLAAVPRNFTSTALVSFERYSAENSGKSHFSFGIFGVPSPSDQDSGGTDQAFLVGNRSPFECSNHPCTGLQRILLPNSQLVSPIAGPLKVTRLVQI